MSTHLMTKRCIYCRRKYVYNPSVGDLGVVCKHCHKFQGLSSRGTVSNRREIASKCGSTKKAK